MANIDLMKMDVVHWIRPHLADSNRDPLNGAIKLAEEVSELQHALYTGDGNVAEELADCLILLLDIAHLTKTDLPAAFEEKMMINRGRKWNKVKGALKHAE